MMKIRIYGTRGMLPVPGRFTEKFGGNTSCVAVRIEEVPDFFIFDAGTGIVRLGEELSRFKGEIKVHLFLSHLHLDHIIGLPFFITAYNPSIKLYIYTPANLSVSAKKILKLLFHPEINPMKIGEPSAMTKIIPVTKRKLKIGGVLIETLPLNHPVATLGYRLTYHDRSFVYMSDHEFLEYETEEEGITSNRQVQEFIRGADLMIGDAQYLPNEVRLYKGWGHSSVHQVVNSAIIAEVKRLVLFHYDPNRSDKQIDDIISHYRKLLKRKNHLIELVGAREGEEYTI